VYPVPLIFLSRGLNTGTVNVARQMQGVVLRLVNTVTSKNYIFFLKLEKTLPNFMQLFTGKEITSSKYGIFCRKKF
jgi:hypothetical protein